MRLANEQLTSEQALSFAKEIERTFKYYPMVMSDLLSEIRAKVTDTSHQMELDTLRRNALLEASTLKMIMIMKRVEQDSRTCKNCCGGTVKGRHDCFGELLVWTVRMQGKLVLNSNYDTSTVRVRYSLDGGKTWTDTTLTGNRRA